MNRDTRTMLQYLKEDETFEVPTYGSFRNQILNDLEMYYEDLMYDDDDVFGGTQDSYANEMVEQHLFDTIYYNIKHNYESNDAAMNTASDLVYYILDFVDHGEQITLQNDKVIKEVYDKYVLNKTEESVESDNGDTAIKDVIDLMRHHSIVKSIPNYILNAKNQLEKENEYYLQKESDIRFAYENFLTDLEEIYNKAIEFQNLVIGEYKNINESVNPRPGYIDYLKQELGDSYSEESTDNSLIIKGTTSKGRPMAAIWYGRAEKPQIYATYPNEEYRDKAIQEFLDRRAYRAEVNAQRKQERRLTKDHDVKIGDIYYTSWGYDQTNIDFYKVVNVRGSRIDLKELTQQYVDRGEGGYDDSVIPGDEFANDKIYTVSARADGTLTSLSSFEYLSKWDGRPKYQTNPYAGH